MGVISDSRERILSRIRTATGGASSAKTSAVEERLRTHPLSPRPSISGDLVAQFRERATRLMNTVAEVAQLSEVPAAAAAYLRAYDLPLRAVCWPALQALAWAQHGIAMEVRPARASDLVGVTEVFCAIAETGTLVTLSGAHTPPVSSLLPETHIAVLRTAQIVPAMEEVWQRIRDTAGELPRAVNFISGPSRTSDIEQTLTLGAHGPYRVHIILVAEGNGRA